MGGGIIQLIRRVQVLNLKTHTPLLSLFEADFHSCLVIACGVWSRNDVVSLE